VADSKVNSTVRIVQRVALSGIKTVYPKEQFGADLLTTTQLTGRLYVRNTTSLIACFFEQEVSVLPVLLLDSCGAV